MTKESYEKCMNWVSQHLGVGTVRVLVKLLTGITAVCYGSVLIGLLYQRDPWMIRMLVIPAFGFLAVTLLRKCIGARRPYQIYEYIPLLDKDSRDNSFPSRHVFSNMIISMAVLSVSVPLGIFLILCGLLLAVLRVVAGVHFPKDVFAGAVLALVLGWIGFFL